MGLIPSGALGLGNDLHGRNNMIVYSVSFHGDGMSSDQPFRLLGIFIKFDAALNIARLKQVDEDDTWIIKQHQIDVLEEGPSVWDSWTDTHRELAYHYERFFPDGFPDEPIAA